jgi:hypothetical protein
MLPSLYHPLCRWLVSPFGEGHSMLTPILCQACRFMYDDACANRLRFDSMLGSRQPCRHTHRCVIGNHFTVTTARRFRIMGSALQGHVPSVHHSRLRLQLQLPFQIPSSSSLTIDLNHCDSGIRLYTDGFIATIPIWRRRRVKTSQSVAIRILVVGMRSTFSCNFRTTLAVPTSARAE